MHVRGRIPISMGANGGSTYMLGQQAGTETVTLTQAQLPAHTHLPNAQSAPGEQFLPTGALWSSKKVFDKPAGGTALVGMDPPTPDVAMNPVALAPTGAGKAHNNMQP